MRLLFVIPALSSVLVLTGCDRPSSGVASVNQPTSITSLEKQAVPDLLKQAASDGMPEKHNWVEVYDDKRHHKVYVDSSSIIRDGTKARAWTMWDLYGIASTDKNKKDWYSSKEFSEYQCAEGKIKVHTSYFYSGHKGSGELVEISRMEKGWEYPINIFRDQHFDGVCKKKLLP